MILRYYGHALFTITLDSGITILTDPYGRFCRYPRRSLDADIVTISHHHYDHDSMEIVRGKPIVLDESGFYTPVRGITVTGTPTFHDDSNGEDRGKNIVFSIAAEGLRIVHMGDIGHLPDRLQQCAIGKVDILLIPVGGTFTLDAEEAVQCVELLKPKVTIPMHYQTRFSMDLGVEPETEFMRLMGECPEPVMQCKIDQDTIGGFPKLLLMDIQE